MESRVAVSQSARRGQVVFAAFLIQALIIGCMFSYGVFFTSLEEDLDWSRTLLSGASSLGFLVMGLFAFISGKLSDLYGPRWVLSAAGVLTGLGYVLMSQMQAPWELLLYFAVFIGLGLSAHDVVTLSTVASWYQARRGLMTGIVKTGTAIGQIVVPLVVTGLIAWYDWRQAMLVSGIVAGLLLLLLAQMMERPDRYTDQLSAERSSEYPVEHSDSPALGARVDGMSVNEATQTRTLWILCAIQFCFFPALMSIPVHIVAHSTDLGMTTETGAWILAAIGGCSIAGRLMTGLSFDKLGGKRSLQLCLIPLALSFFLLMATANVSGLFLFALIYGFAHGGLFTIISPIVAEYFGMRSHGAIFGVVLFFGTLGGAAGPIVVGMIFDRSGSYDSAFLILAVLAIIGFALASGLRAVDSCTSHHIDIAP